MFWQYEAIAKDTRGVKKTVAVSADRTLLLQRVTAYLKKNPDHVIQYRACLSRYRCEYDGLVD